jgi:hypothetical protein
MITWTSVFDTRQHILDTVIDTVLTINFDSWAVLGSHISDIVYVGLQRLLLDLETVYVMARSGERGSCKGCSVVIGQHAIFRKWVGHHNNLPRPNSRPPSMSAPYAVPPSRLAADI